MEKPPKRVRRTPDEARRLILDAALAAIGAAGPAAIRLAQVAARAGVSHSTVLHHFGSREGLILALNHRVLEGLQAQLTRMMDASGDDGNGLALTFAAYRDGLAQRVAWLLQTGAYPAGGTPAVFEAIAAALHRLRVRVAPSGAEVDVKDSRAIAHLTAIAAFGDAMIGPRLRAAPNLDAEQQQRQRFEHWLSLLLNRAI